ncbi:MAG: methyltransferase domain-containing protein [Phycisphaerales bacterium]|nr:methyltransferase domain-containing protein [Phycisphaerales bacterium]
MDKQQAESACHDRYSLAATNVEPALCCPVDYDAKWLKAIPQEVIDCDYGCGDPSKYVQEGETVLDLGSGAGKICFIASQVVGKEGKVIGVDMNDEMLFVANKFAPVVANTIGYANVEFHKGNIVNMQGIVDDNSIDVVVSNCVLNLVSNNEKPTLFKELYRVTTPGGRAVISDIVSNEDVPTEMQGDDYLWSGCISGAMKDDAFVEAFADAGFDEITVVKHETDPWQTVNGIEFRSMTVVACKADENGNVDSGPTPEDNDCCCSSDGCC